MEQRLLAGRYALAEPLGEGSWRATDTELGREVVVRVGAAAEVAATTLAHPNIVRIFDQGEADGERYAVLEHLPGGSLAEHGPLTEEAARDVAAALAYAHGQGVAHGALSPETVLFDEEGRAKVADFGATGEPEDDVRAFGAMLAEAPGLGTAAAAALAGDLAGTTDALRPAAPAPAPAAEPTTQILRPAAAPRSRRSPVLALVVLVALLAAGAGAAFLLTADDSESADEPADSLSVPVPTGSVASTVSELPTAPPPPSTEETTTEETTTAPTTTSPPPTTTAPPPTTAPPLPTTAPPTPTEPPPPTETEAPPPLPTETTPLPTDPAD